MHFLKYTGKYLGYVKYICFTEMLAQIYHKAVIKVC